MRIAELFKITRIAKGIMQVRLAEAIGISVSAFARFEGGKLSLSNDTLLRIAPYLDINPDYVIGASKCPFKSSSNGLIKFFVEKHHFHDDRILATVRNSSDNIEFYSLTPHLSILERIRHLNVADQPTYALLIQDGFSNLFLFRSKSNKDFMAWENVHISRDTYFMKLTNKRGWYDKVFISKDLYEKISRWDDLYIDEFKSLMEESKKNYNEISYKVINNNQEADFISNLRKYKVSLSIANRSIGLMNDLDDHNIDPEEVRKLIRRHYGW